MTKSSDFSLKDSKFENVQNSECPQPVFLNTCFDKTQVKNLVSWVLENSGEKKTLSFLESLKSMGFHQATQAGISLGIDDLEIPPEKGELISQTSADMKRIEQQSASGSRTSVEKSQFLIDTWNQTSEQLRHNAVQNFKSQNILNPVYMMAFSGARGNISQVRQLVAMRGLMADPQGAILEFPIQSNFREGLTITEYLISCYGARKGLVDTALRTATSGYLTRRLVDSAQHAVVSLIDCETTKGIQLRRKNTDSRFIGRVLAQSVEIDNETIFERNTVISINIAQQLSLCKKTILIRSPLTCESQTTVCQFCYGINLATGTLVTLGEAVGVIAAQSIGEPGTQLTMRTFHTGGVGVFSEQAMKPITSPYNGYVEYLETLTGHFVRTPHGSIRYMVKHISTNGELKVLRIRPINPNQQEFYVYESELPPGSLLVVKQGEYVSAKQLVAQSSQLQLAKKKFPESSHPVYSPCEGQIFFESMRLTVEQQFLQRGKEHEKEIRFLESKDIVPSQSYLNRTQNVASNIGKGLPDIRTMTQIGSFWVLEAQNKVEVQSASPLLKIGDLVASNSVLFQYNVCVKEQKQLHKIEDQLAVGLSGFQLLVSSINFQNFVYRIKLKNSVNDILLYPKLSPKPFQESSFVWYPSFEFNSQKNDLFYELKFTSYILTDKEILEDETFSLNRKEGSFHGAQHLYRKNHVFSQATQGSFLSLHQPLKKLLSPNFVIILQRRYMQKFQKGNELYFTVNGRTRILKNLSNLLKNKIFTQILYVKNPKTIKAINCFNKSENKRDKTKQIVPFNCSILSQENNGWVIYPKFNQLLVENSLSTRIFLPVGSSQETILIPKQNVLLEYIPTNKLVYSFKKTRSIGWYNAIQLIDINKDWLGFFDKNFKLCKTSSYIKKPKIWYSFSEKIKDTDSKQHLEQRLLQTKSVREFENNDVVSRQVLCSVCCKHVLHSTPPPFVLSIKKLQNTRIKTNKEIYIHWTKLQINPTNKYLKNIHFSKQHLTSFHSSSTKTVNFLSHIAILDGWFKTQLPLKVTVQNFDNSTFTHSEAATYVGFEKQTLQPHFSLFCYNQLSLKNLQSLRFQTFSKNWISPNSELTKGYISTKTYGEFHSLEESPNGTTTSILVNPNFVTFKVTRRFNENSLTVGSVIRQGDEFVQGLGSQYNGQIVKYTGNYLTLRLGIPFLASARGLIHIFQNQIIRKNQLLLTLKSRRLQTEDIVQGIPKIEQLFEARESQGGEILQDTVHTRLQNYFVSELQQLNGQHWAVAVEKSFLQAQYFLVEGIIDAYGNQGVKISEKHVEVIVRQMTSRVRILDGGDTGFLPGELVNHQRIQFFNKQLYENNLREATYEPMVLGISKSVLQSDSFLLAASFQEVSRVLVKSALSKKRDFLRGLHENVIVGQVIPAGTGLLSQTGITTSELEQKLTLKKHLIRSL